MDCETWKDIKGYEGSYWASSYGNIKSRRKILKPYKTGTNRNYLSVCLFKNKLEKLYYIHRLVLETFIGSCPLGMECRHLDGNSSNNRLDNLKWGTPHENQQDRILHNTYQYGSKNPMAKLNDNKIREIRKLHIEGKTNREIAKIYKVSTRAIRFIINKERWKHVQ